MTAGTTAPARKSLADWRKTKGTPLAREKGAGRNRDTDECRKVWQYAAKVCREQRHAILPSTEKHYLAEETARAIAKAFEHETREMLYMGAKRFIEPHPERIGA